MPSFDTLFGPPSSVVSQHAGGPVAGPVDLLPDHAVSLDSVVGGGEGRDVLLAASPFSSEARKFFNTDSRKVTGKAPVSPQAKQAQIDEDNLYGTSADGAVGPDGTPLQPRVPDASGKGSTVDVDPLLNALGPRIEDISRFGLPGAAIGAGAGNSIADFDEDALREQLRAVLRRVK